MKKTKKLNKRQILWKNVQYLCRTQEEMREGELDTVSRIQIQEGNSM